jgi:hypothetical protein
MNPCTSLPADTGPTELMRAEFDFHTTPFEYSPIPIEFLRFTMNTYNVHVEEKFSDVHLSPGGVVRTISHHVPLDKVSWCEWIERDLVIIDLPKEWYEFWSKSGMWALSTFSKKTTYLHSSSVW